MIHPSLFIKENNLINLQQSITFGVAVGLCQFIRNSNLTSSIKNIVLTKKDSIYVVGYMAQNPTPELGYGIYSMYTSDILDVAILVFESLKVLNEFIDRPNFLVFTGNYDGSENQEFKQEVDEFYKKINWCPIAFKEIAS
jgi:hypothetical protein